MTEKLLKIKFEGTMGMKHEVSPRTLDFIKNKSGEVYCHYRYHNFNMQKEVIKKQLDIRTINDFLKELSLLIIPAFPQYHLGCDGGYTEIEIGDYNGKSHYRWWSSPPKGWEQLDEITQKIINYCDIEEPSPDE